MTSAGVFENRAFLGELQVARCGLPSGGLGEWWLERAAGMGGTVRSQVPW